MMANHRVRFDPRLDLPFPEGSDADQASALIALGVVALLLVAAYFLSAETREHNLSNQPTIAATSSR